MLQKWSFKQKSPKRRFLFILGVAILVCISTLGLMILFWDKLPLNLNRTQRNWFGAIFIVYAILRSVRIFTGYKDEE